MAPVAMQCFWSMKASAAVLDGRENPLFDAGSDERDDMWRAIVNTCHIWDEHGPEVAARRRVSRMASRCSSVDASPNSVGCPDRDRSAGHERAPADRVVGLLDGIETTRTIRRYTDEPVPDAALRDDDVRSDAGPERLEPTALPDAAVDRRAQEPIAAKRIIGEAARSAWAAKRTRDSYDSGVPEPTSGLAESTHGAA